MDAAELRSWIGRERVTEDTVSLSRARALAATLDLDAGSLEEGVPLPPAWHWIYFHTVAPRSELAEDGHALRGDFLPPVELPHRMWAGGRLRFPGVLTIGARARRVSTVRSIERKEGRSGPLVFVTVEHRVSGADGTAVEEEQTLVYLGGRRQPSASSPATPRATLEGVGEHPEWSEPFTADEVTLFRFSALTFNSHRIHYDRRYATDVEGYPDIVVHGPLLALLLVNAGVRRLGITGGPAGELSFRYRAVQPLFCNEAFTVQGRALEGLASSASEGGRSTMALWAEHPERGVATEATLVASASHS